MQKNKFHHCPLTSVTTKESFPHPGKSKTTAIAIFRKWENIILDEFAWITQKNAADFAIMEVRAIISELQIITDHNTSFQEPFSDEKFILKDRISFWLNVIIEVENMYVKPPNDMQCGVGKNNI